MQTVTKTISVKIFEPTKMKMEALQDLLHISTGLSAFYVSTMGRLNTHSKKELHKETYYAVKMMFEGIPTGLIQTIRDKAVETYKSYKARVKAGKKASLPTFKSPVIRFDNRTFTLHETDNSFGYFVSVSTRQGRVFLPIQYGDFQKEVLEKISLGMYKFCIAELSFSNRLNSYILNITYEYIVDAVQTTTSMGVDLGVKNFAVLAVPGQMVKFFNGKRHNQKRIHYSNVRKALGKKKLIKKIKSIGNKEQRYMKDVNHKISKQIVEVAKAHKASIHLEDLANIREKVKFSRKVNKMLHNWNFYQLQTFIEYKANAAGLQVIYVDRTHTSQKCNFCEYIDKANRKNQSTFKCKSCGYQAHADYNASVNIANLTAVG